MAFFRDPLANYAGMPFVLATPDESHGLLAALAHCERSVGDLTSAFAPPRRAAIVRTIGWLLKCGMVEMDTTTS